MKNPEIGDLVMYQSGEEMGEVAGVVVATNDALTVAQSEVPPITESANIHLVYFTGPEPGQEDGRQGLTINEVWDAPPDRWKLTSTPELRRVLDHKRVRELSLCSALLNQGFSGGETVGFYNVLRDHVRWKEGDQIGEVNG